MCHKVHVTGEVGWGGGGMNGRREGRTAPSWKSFMRPGVSAPPLLPDLSRSSAHCRAGEGEDPPVTRTSPIFCFLGFERLKRLNQMKIGYKRHSIHLDSNGCQSDQLWRVKLVTWQCSRACLCRPRRERIAQRFKCVQAGLSALLLCVSSLRAWRPTLSTCDS